MHTRNLWSIIAMVVVIAMIVSCATPPPQSGPAQQATAAQKAPEQAPAPAAATKAPEKAAAPAASQPKSGGTLNLALSSDFDTFDPYFDTSTVEFKAPFFEAPVRLSDDGKLSPGWPKVGRQQGRTRDHAQPTQGRQVPQRARDEGRRYRLVGPTAP